MSQRSRGCPTRLFCSLYADRGHYWNTRPRPAARWTRTPRPRRPRSRFDPGLLARGKGALGAHVRHLAEAPAPGANSSYQHSPASPTWSRPTAWIKEVFLPQHNARFATPAEDRGTAFVPFTGALDDSCASTRNAPSQTTTRCATSAWHFRSPPAEPPPLRQGQGPRPRIPRRHNGCLAHGSGTSCCRSR